MGARVSGVRGLAVLAAVLSGCARTPHVPVDVQVDVDAPLPEDAESVRLCVEEGVARTFGAAAGRFALVGVDPALDPLLEVQALDGDGAVIGSAGPVSLDASYLVVDYGPCEECGPCIGGGSAPAAEDEAWTVGVRFH